MYKVLIADDEKLARDTIKLLLKSYACFTEIEQARNGKEALEKISAFKPNLIFLDIEMPIVSGLEVAKTINDKCNIIFITAYDKFAINAFELNAIDYLLKPFDDERFALAISKIITKLSNEQGKSINHAPIAESQLKKLLSLMISENNIAYKSKIIVKDPGRIRLIEVDDIVYIQGAGNYADIHLNDGSHLLHRETLSSLECQLDPNVFIRIHRSTIVKKSQVIELKPNDNGDYCVLTQTKKELTLSRRNRDKLSLLLA